MPVSRISETQPGCLCLLGCDVIGHEPGEDPVGHIVRSLNHFSPA